MSDRAGRPGLLAGGTRLLAASPNPFNPITRIEFELAAAGRVEIAIYDVSGRLVRTLLDEHRRAGGHSVTWDGRDGAGSAVASGIYFYSLNAGTFSQTKKLILMK
jgi:flagellar hook assembly protein FlgD